MDIWSLATHLKKLMSELVEFVGREMVQVFLMHVNYGRTTVGVCVNPHVLAILETIKRMGHGDTSIGRGDKLLVLQFGQSPIPTTLDANVSLFDLLARIAS